jgi:hypothetical protein
MTYRGHVRNGAVVLDLPATLPEGAAVEVNVIAPAAAQVPAITSIDQLRSKLPGDPFGDSFESTVRQWRQEPWRYTDPLAEEGE